MEDAYELAAQTIQEVLQNGRSLKQVVFNGPAVNKKKVYAIAIETMKQKSKLQNVLKDAGLSTDKDAYYFWMVLAYEHAFGNARGVSEYAREQEVERELQLIAGACSNLKTNDQQADGAATKNEASGTLTLPKYVRVNTLKCTMDEVINELVGSGYEEKRVDIASLTFRKWRKVVSKLNRELFVRDFDFPNEVLVFAHNADLHTLSGFGAAHFIITDKSSMLPALALAPPRNACVLDACAAPGNKTALLGSLLENTGSVLAFDRDAGRFRTLQRRIRQLGLRNAYCANCDFLRVAPPAFAHGHAKGEAHRHGQANSQQYGEVDPAALARVEYILVDPSCSGSGMVSRIANDAEFAHTETQSQGAFGTQKNAERLKKLSNFQSMLLRHALTAFPKVKRVVYSTCSLFEEENECVVRDVLSHDHVRNRYRLVLPDFTKRLGGVKTPHAENDDEPPTEGRKRKADSNSEPEPESEPVPERDAVDSSSKADRKKRRKIDNTQSTSGAAQDVDNGNAETGVSEELTLASIRQCTLRMDPRRALTNGFFVACFERVSNA